MKSDKNKIKLCNDCYNNLINYIEDLSMYKQLENAIDSGMIKNGKIQHSKCIHFSTDCIHRGIEDDCPDYTEDVIKG